MPWTAHFIIAANAIFPNLTGCVMKMVNALLPAHVSQSGDEAQSGAEVRGKK
jgi:hypothetical protein